MFSRVGELYPMIVCSFGYISSSIEKYVLWVVHLFMYEIKFEEFIFANNLFGLSDDGDGGYDDDLEKLMDNSVSMK